MITEAKIYRRLGCHTSVYSEKVAKIRGKNKQDVTFEEYQFVSDLEN